MNIVIALLILNIMIIAHELGHYLFAKRNRVGVHEFAIGFGPILWQKKWNNTLWLIKLFPLGGYNALKGETTEEKGNDSFSSASKKVKFQVLIAGSLMNIVMAVVAFYIALGLYGWKIFTPVDISPVGAALTPSGDGYPVVFAYVADSPASKLGLSLPFSIKQIDGLEVKSSAEVVTAITTSTKSTLSLVVVDKGETKTVDVTRNAESKIGIQIENAPMQLDYSTKWYHTVFSGFSHTINTVKITGKVLGYMIKETFKTKDVEMLGYAFSGPVAIVAAVGSVVESSQTIIADLANMTGLIGVSLALFNLFPFPGLDGWHIFLLFYEKARGRKANEKIVGTLSAIGILFLLALGVVIMFKDVWLFFIK
jgi:regulator of sigma E protease